MWAGLYRAPRLGMTSFWLCMCGSSVPFTMASVVEIFPALVSFPSDTVIAEGEWWA